MGIDRYPWGCGEGILKVVWWLDLWWWKNTVNVFSFFLSFFLAFGLTCNDASNRSVFALIPKLTQDNQNKTKTTIK